MFVLSRAREDGTAVTDGGDGDDDGDGVGVAAAAATLLLPPLLLHRPPA